MIVCVRRRRQQQHSCNCQAGEAPSLPPGHTASMQSDMAREETARCEAALLTDGRGDVQPSLWEGSRTPVAATADSGVLVFNLIFGLQSEHVTQPERRLRILAGSIDLGAHGQEGMGVFSCVSLELIIMGDSEGVAALMCH